MHEFDHADEDVSELIYLIEHEPAVGGFLGASELEHREHMRQIDALIECLAAHGGDPDR